MYVHEPKPQDSEENTGRSFEVTQKKKKKTTGTSSKTRPFYRVKASDKIEHTHDPPTLI